MATRNDLVIHQSTQPETFSFSPRNLEEAEKYAGIIANSAICPTSFKGRPGDVLVILQMGYELGLKPMQALRALGCVNGHPFAYGDGLLALVKRHASFLDIKEWFEGDLKDGSLTAFCKIWRKNQEPQMRSFSIEDAKRAALYGKSVWAAYPKRMLQHRARGYACRDVFPDALYGLMSQEEAESVPKVIDEKPMLGKGINGLKETLGIVKTEEIIEGETVDIETGEVVVQSKLDELKGLIEKCNVTQSVIAKTLKSANVESIDDLPEHSIDKWIAHLKSKESQNDRS